MTILNINRNNTIKIKIAMIHNNCNKLFKYSEYLYYQLNNKPIAIIIAVLKLNSIAQYKRYLFNK